MKLSLVLILTATLASHTVDAQVVAGKTLVARGPVQALTTESNEQRKLRRRSPIYGNDLVSTGDQGKAQLRMTDGGMIALKPNTQLQIAEYQFSEQTERGSVVMELVKGGLRSVTGAIKSESGDYKLKTPVGSIGIRGTHYEVEIVGSTLWVAVWDGAVDLEIDTGSQAGSTLSLGTDEGFSYASVEAGGEVTTYIEPPETFESGMTTEADEVDQQEDPEEQEADEQQSGQTNTTPTSAVAVRATVAEDEGVVSAQEEAEQEAEIETAQQTAILEEENLEVPDEAITTANDAFNSADNASIAELLEQRQGSFTYSQLSQSSVSSSAGEVTDFRMAITVDFANSAVPGGDLSFNDDGGEWFATFDGHIVGEGLDLEFSKVTHGNKLGDGTINASFLDGLDSLLGNFTLQENLNPDINVTGSFIIK